MRKDFAIDNIVEYFENIFCEKYYSTKVEELKDIAITEQFTVLMPDSYKEVAKEVVSSKLKNFTDFEEIKSFDSIL